MKVAVINTQVPFVYGGAEILADQLVSELLKRDVDATLVTVPFKWYPQDTLIKHVHSCWNLDLTEANGHKIDKVICLKFPVYCIPHESKVLWLCHQHRSVYDLENHELSGLDNSSESTKLKSFVKFADNEAFSKTKKLYTISGNVSKRLKKYNGFDSTPLYPPISNLSVDQESIKYDQFLFCPSRVNKLKRQHLIVESFCISKSNLKLIFTGEIEDIDYMNDITQIIKRYGRENDVIFLGHVSLEKLSELYHNCQGVIFTPLDEDYGYITLEAMSCRKAVLTLTDSGGSTEFIQDKVNGLVVNPDTEDIANAINTISELNVAKNYGSYAFENYNKLNINWDYTITKLLL